MASDNRPEIVLDGDISPFRQKLREAAADLKRFGDDGSNAFSRMTGPLGALQSKFIAIGALLAGGKVFQAAVEETTKLTGEANALSKAFGISTTEAGALNIALGDIYSSADDFIGASQQLGRQLRTNEDGLNAMGLRTRETNGEYRNMKDLMLDSIKVLAGYKEGTDRNLAAQTMFGKGAAETTKFLKLNNEVIEEARQKQEALGLVVGVENVEAAKQYKASMNDAGDVISAYLKVVGDALLPVLTKLANWFSAIGPAAVQLTKYSVGGLVSAFWILKHAVVVVWETINAMVVTVAEPIRALGTAIGKALAGDFEGAKQSLTDIPTEISAAWKQANIEIGESAAEIDKKISALFGKPTAMTNKPTGSKGYTPPPDDNKKAGQDASFMQYYDAALAEEKRLASEKDALREYTKEQELAFWQTLLQHASLTTKDQVAIEKKASELTVAIRRQEAKEKQALDIEANRFSEEMAMGRVDAEKAAAETALANGQITNEQMAQLEIQFEEKRLEIQRAALQERLLMAEQDPNASPVERQRIQDQILLLEQQHSIRMIHLQRQLSQASGRIWDDLGQRMTGLWDKGINALMNGTLRWRNAFRAIGAELVNWFATTVVGNMVKTWLAGEAKKLAIKLGFLGKEEMAQEMSSQKVVATKFSEGTSVAAVNAVEAGTGAAASQAPIPFVGPILALAAMAAIFAAVSAMGGRIKSASKGYAIPKGVNPMMQLHEEEVVLPSHLSKGIAGLIEQGGAGGGGGDIFAPKISIHALDSRDVARALKQGGALHKALKDYQRRGVIKPS